MPITFDTQRTLSKIVGAVDAQDVADAINTATTTTWGSITGAMAAQGDLTTALAGKLGTAATAAAATKLATARNINGTAFDGTADITIPTGMTPPPTHEVYVDGGRTDTYTQDGSLLTPFKTIQAAIDALTGTRNTIKVSAGVYTESLTIASDNYICVELHGAHIIGNITWNVSSAAALYKPKLIFVGADMRSYYPTAQAYHLTGIQGNINVFQDRTVYTYTGLHLINTGCTGNINATSTGTTVLHVFCTDGGYNGDFITDSHCVGILYAYSSASSGSSSIGGASGNVAGHTLYNVVITRPWLIGGGSAPSGGGDWYNVQWKTGSSFNTGTPHTGAYRADANSYASYLANVTPGSETFTLLDTAIGVKNTPAGGISSTNVQAAINELDTEKANLAGATFTGSISATNLSGTNTGDEPHGEYDFGVSASIAPNLALARQFIVTQSGPTGDLYLGMPSNPAAGQFGRIVVRTIGTGMGGAFGHDPFWHDATGGFLFTIAANRYDMLEFVIISNMKGVITRVTQNIPVT
jgi:hypothetical protein